MEHLLRFLPSGPQGRVVRYGATTLIVLLCFLLQKGLEYHSGFLGFFLLLPGIFIAALLFDRGSGFYATALSTALSIVALSPSGNIFLLPPQYIAPIVLFFLIGLVMATVSEALRKALERAVAAERATHLMLNELNHRIRNNLSILASVLGVQMRSHDDPATKAAFASAVGRVHVIANAHDHLMPHDAQSAIDMSEYLTACCRNLGDALRDVRPIAVNVSAADIRLASDKAVAVGLIINELVTNAFKYAFPDDRAGTVTVTLRRSKPKELMLSVEDNGKGCPENSKEGLGSRIVRLLAQQLRGFVRREAATPGCRILLTFPDT